MVKQVLHRWLPVLVWMGLIFWLSSIHDLASLLPSMADLILRKFAHATEFAILTFLIIRAVRRISTASLLFIAVFALLFAASDELHQGVVAGRTASSIDVLVDGWGVMIAILAIARNKKLTGRPLYR